MIVFVIIFVIVFLTVIVLSIICLERSQPGAPGETGRVGRGQPGRGLCGQPLPAPGPGLPRHPGRLHHPRGLQLRQETLIFCSNILMLQRQISYVIKS